MAAPVHVADLLLKIELQLKAYQQLHEEELAELWKVLDDCKRTIVGENMGARIPEETRSEQLEAGYEINKEKKEV